MSSVTRESPVRSVVERVAHRVQAVAPLPDVPAAVQERVDGVWAERLGTLDLDALRGEFFRDGEFLVLRDLVPRELCEEALAEIDRARPTRSRMPWVRSAQHVGWRALQRCAPLSAALYRSTVVRSWMSTLVGVTMQLKDAQDDHACATYEYERAGDGMRFHYDTCGCEEGASYTQLLSLCDRSTQRLLVDLHKKDGRPVERREVQTPPGTFVIFCGSKVWHGVSPLGEGERRVILSMSYAKNPSMPPWRRLYENVKDAVLYFGPGAALQRNFRTPR
jgi:hypothetical protein